MLIYAIVFVAMLFIRVFYLWHIYLLAQVLLILQPSFNIIIVQFIFIYLNVYRLSMATPKVAYNKWNQNNTKIKLKTAPKPYKYNILEDKSKAKKLNFKTSPK